MKRIFSYSKLILLCLMVFGATLPLLQAKDGRDASKNDQEIRRIRKDRIKNILKMSEMRTEKGRQDLENVLENDTDRHSREASAIALGKSGNKKAIPKLRERLKDKDVNIRMRSVWALAKLGDKSGKPHALEAIKGDDVTGQLLAAEALESIEDKDVIPQLKENLNDKRVTVRWHSKVAIKKVEMSSMSEQEKVNYLEKILSSDEMNNWSAIELAKIGSDSAIAVLKKVAKDRNNKGSFAAQKALNKLKEMGKIP